MRSTFFATASLACLFYTIANASLTRDDIIIDQGCYDYLWDCNFSISEDMIATWSYSIKTSTPNNFARLGPSSTDNVMKRVYTDSIKLHKQHNVSALFFTDWKVEGIYSLSAGVTAIATLTAEGAGVATTVKTSLQSEVGS